MAVPKTNTKPTSKRPRRLPSPPCSASSDLRTRAGRRAEILAQICEHDGFSIFWVTENHLRACVAEEMQRRGEIITDNKAHGFPWIGAKISKQNATGEAKATTGCASDAAN